MLSSLAAAIDQTRAEIKPAKLYLFGARRASYGELFDQVLRLTTLFADLGLARGDRVVVSSQDDLAVLALFTALVRNGLTAVMLDPESPPVELAKLVETADARALFLDESRAMAAELQAALRPGAEIIPIKFQANGAARPKLSLFGRREATATRVYPTLLASLQPAAGLPAEIPDETVAYILFTSGTTSRPKGVEISHKNLHAQMRTFIRHYGLDEQTRLMNLLPLHHTDGLTHGGMVSLLAGATLYRPARFSVDALPALLDTVYRERITNFITVPSVLSLIVSLGEQYIDCFATPDFKFLISTAAYLDETLWRKFEERYRVRIVNVYGLTETVCESLYCGPDEATRRVGTIGKPIDAEARIVGEDGAEVAAGETGELQLKGDHVMAGYFRMPEETAAVLSDGWFRTGDLCWKDADGFYHIVGRKKDVIITGGVNVYPEDVTGVLRDLPDVLDAVTFGLPDETWGERVVACVLPRPGAVLSVEVLASAFLERASRQKLPKEIHILDEFPRGPAGKVITAEVKRQVAALAKAGAANGHGAAVGNGHGTAEQRVLGIAARSFKTAAEALSLDSNAENTRGWNSLAHVEFLLGIEKEFGLKMTPQDIMKIRSLGDALTIVAQRAAP